MTTPSLPPTPKLAVPCTAWSFAINHRYDPHASAQVYEVHVFGVSVQWASCGDIDEPKWSVVYFGYDGPTLPPEKRHADQSFAGEQLWATQQEARAACIEELARIRNEAIAQANRLFRDRPIAIQGPDGTTWHASATDVDAPVTRA